MTPHRLLAQTLQASRRVLVSRNWLFVGLALSDVLDAFRAAVTINCSAALLILESSLAFKAVQALAVADAWSVRDAALFTLAQFGSRKALPDLYTTFHSRCDTDPLLVQRFLNEIGWLEGNRAHHRQEQRLRRVLNSPNFLTRWSLLTSHGPVSQGVLLRLSQDRHPLVAAEAKYRQEAHRLRLQTFTQGSAVRRRLLKQAVIGEPLTFLDASLKFERYLVSNNQFDYKNEQFVEFVNSI